MVAKSSKKIVIILGETASGKSEVAMKLAELFDGEIISADSWAVYKGFDIGTSKPSKRDQKKIKHHLIDVADPKIGYSAAVFKRQASKAVEDILKKGKLPIISGGTGLYIDSLIYSYGFLPGSNKSEREKYNSMSVEELRHLTVELGYDTGGIDLNNKRRIIRLLENKGKRPTSKPIRDDIIIFGMTIDRDKLKQKIEKRVDDMFRKGLEKEVVDLSKLYGWDIEPMKGIGYREFREYLDGSITLDETKQKIIKNTIDLAKKQRTWFKRNKSIHWVNNSNKIVEILTTHLNK
jgi:tRNA dimethylallyltransferase